MAPRELPLQQRRTRRAEGFAVSNAASPVSLYTGISMNFKIILYWKVSGWEEVTAASDLFNTKTTQLLKTFKKQVTSAEVVLRAGLKKVTKSLKQKLWQAFFPSVPSHAEDNCLSSASPQPRALTQQSGFETCLSCSPLGLSTAAVKEALTTFYIISK